MQEQTACQQNTIALCYCLRPIIIHIRQWNWNDDIILLVKEFPRHILPFWHNTVSKCQMSKWIYSAISRKSISIELGALVSNKQDRLHCAPKDTAANSRFTQFDRQPDGLTPNREGPHRYCGTIKWCRLADRRCRLAMSATGVPDTLILCSSRHRRKMTASLYSTNRQANGIPQTCTLHA